MTSREWFAVDADECVAIFHTGEAGLMPDVAAGGKGAMDEFLEAVLSGTIGSVEYYMDDLMSGSGHKLEAHLKEGIPIWDLIAATNSDKGLQALLKLPSAKKLRNSKSKVVYVETIDCDDLERLIKDGSIEKGWVGHPLMPERFGVYYYRCHDHEAGELYEREQEPHQPIKLVDLPDDWVELFEQVCFASLTFSEASDIAPSDYFECSAIPD